MPQRIVSLLCSGGGFIAISLGVLLARDHLRRARRLHRKTGLIHAAMPEGWGSWFFQGFADLTAGTRWAVAACLLVFWMIVGIGLVSVGVRLAW